MVLAGDLIRASDNFSAWESFTPSFSNFTIGNGSRSGRWRRIGDLLILVRAQFTMGSTSAVTGALGLVLPGGLSCAADQLMVAIGYDASAGAGHTGTLNSQSGGGTTYDRVFGPGINWNGTTPFTWATNDILRVQGWVEVTT